MIVAESGSIDIGWMYDDPLLLRSNVNAEFLVAVSPESVVASLISSSDEEVELASSSDGCELDAPVMSSNEPLKSSLT